MSISVAWFPDYGHIVAGMLFTNARCLGGMWNARTKGRLLYVYCTIFRARKTLQTEVEKVG